MLKNRHADCRRERQHLSSKVYSSKVDAGQINVDNRIWPDETELRVLRALIMLSKTIKTAAIFCSVALVFAVGCTKSTNATLSTTVGNRNLTATIDDAAAVSSLNGTAVITFGRTRMTVTDKSVQLNGKDIAELPKAAKSIDIVAARGTITVSADNQPLATAKY